MIEWFAYGSFLAQTDGFQEFSILCYKLWSILKLLEDGNESARFQVPHKQAK